MQNNLRWATHRLEARVVARRAHEEHSWLLRFNPAPDIPLDHLSSYFLDAAVTEAHLNNRSPQVLELSAEMPLFDHKVLLYVTRERSVRGPVVAAEVGKCRRVCAEAVDEQPSDDADVGEDGLRGEYAVGGRVSVLEDNWDTRGQVDYVGHSGF